MCMIVNRSTMYLCFFSDLEVIHFEFRQGPVILTRFSLALKVPLSSFRPLMITFYLSLQQFVICKIWGFHRSVTILLSFSLSFSAALFTYSVSLFACLCICYYCPIHFVFVCFSFFLTVVFLSVCVFLSYYTFFFFGSFLFLCFSFFLSLFVSLCSIVYAQEWGLDLPFQTSHRNRTER